MSLLFRYQPYAVPNPIMSLGGRFVRPRPVVMVSLTGPLRNRPVDALLDSGSDDTVFPEYIAASIGLDLTAAPTGYGTAANMTGLPLRYALVPVRLSDGRSHLEWCAWVGFTAVRLSIPMLGFAGCLQFFDADFRSAREEVELAVNPLYPGT